MIILIKANLEDMITDTEINFIISGNLNLYLQK